MRSGQVTDAAQRMSDIVNGMIIAHPREALINSWMAFRLADGTSDGVLYDTRKAAVRHQTDETLCCYISMRESHGGMTPRAADAILTFHRMAYDAGARLVNPDDVNGGRHTILPLGREVLGEHMRRLLTLSGLPASRYRKES